MGDHRHRPRFLAALAALGALAVAACGGTSPTASAVASAAALPAGTYTSVNFQPAVTFTVPDGWVIRNDSPGYFGLQPADNDLIGVHLFRDPSAASQDESCAAAPEAGVGGSAGELVRWIQDRPGLVVGAPGMATIGGLQATSLDVALRADWTQACPFANGVPSVPLFNSEWIDHWVVVGNERLRLHLLDLPGGGTVVVDQDAFDGEQIEELLAMSNGILRSLEFATEGGSAAPASSDGASVAP